MFNTLKFVFYELYPDRNERLCRLQAHIQRIVGNEYPPLQALTEKSPTVRWLTADDVCKALSITKRALQYYRSCGIIPYTAIGNKVVFREEDVRRLLEKNLIKAE